MKIKKIKSIEEISKIIDNSKIELIERTANCIIGNSRELPQGIAVRDYVYEEILQKFRIFSVGIFFENQKVCIKNIKYSKSSNGKYLFIYFWFKNFNNVVSDIFLTFMFDDRVGNLAAIQKYEFDKDFL